MDSIGHKPVITAYFGAQISPDSAIVDLSS